MNELLKFGFELATEPLGLPIEWYWECLILGIIEFIAYKTAYYNVGKLYRDHQICGKTEGSLIHWLIKFAMFVAVWAITYGIIKTYYFFAEYPSTLMIIPTIISTGFLCKETVGLMRDIKQWRNERNA